MIWDYLKIILALALVWPRGYVLIYLIDRSKSMSFGFKFFAGWMLGLAGFTLDLFATNVFSGLSFSPVVFLASSVTQIFGFSFMIFIFERKIPYPKLKNFIPFVKKQLHNFSGWLTWEKIGLGLLLLTLVIRIGSSLWQITNIPTYDFDAWHNWNLRAKVIYTQDTIPLDKGDPFRLGGGVKSYPLNDGLLKVWLATAAGDFQDKYINLTGLIYYLLLIGVFYFSLPKEINRGLRLLATYFLSSLPLVWLHAHIGYVDLLMAIFIYLSFMSMFYYLAGRGNSFYYLSGITLAFSIWTKNEGLSVILPLMIFTTLILLIMHRVKLKDFLLQWFFTILTVLPWLAFRVIHRLDVLTGDSSTFNILFNQEFIADILSSIFLRSHFNFLWVAVLVIVILKFKDILKDFSLTYLTLSLAALFVFYNSVILFTDKATDLSALARINMQLTPLAILLLIFLINKFFGKINTYAR